MLFQVLSIVAPVFELVVVGRLYARRHGPDMAATNRQDPETVAAIPIWGNLASLVTITLTLAALLG